MKKLLILIFLISLLSPAFAFSPAPSSLKALSFSLKDLSGKSVTLNSFKGQVVLIAFFTTWCPSCQDEVPQVQRLYEKYRSRGFDVVGINIKETAESVRIFAKENKLSFNILLDEKGTVAKAYQVRYIPKLFILDKSGKVVFQAQYMPQDQIEKELVKILQ